MRGVSANLKGSGTGNGRMYVYVSMTTSTSGVVVGREEEVASINSVWVRVTLGLCEVVTNRCGYPEYGKIR